MKSLLSICLCLFLALHLLPVANAQSIKSGTVTGTVADPSGAVIPGATALIRNAVTGHQETTVTDATGTFRFNNLPLTPFQLTVTAPGFGNVTQSLEVRSAVPVT